MNETEMKLGAINRLESYHLLAFFFLALPDQEFVVKVMNAGFDQSFKEEIIGSDVFRGFQLLEKFILANKLKTLDAVLLDISIDRTQLLRGLSEEGPRPPYESVYLQKPPQKVLAELIKMYGQADYAVRLEGHESPEQIGIELSFMAELCQKEKVILEKDGEESEELQKVRTLQANFMQNHLGKWSDLYADEMYKFARTDFYRGVALILKGFLTEERTYLSR